MAKKTFISVKRGLTQDPKHRERMGNRVWLFLHIIDRADFETGQAYDWKDKQEAEDMGLNWRTLQRQRQELEELGYIRCELTGRGMSIVIYNWHNPRSYSGEAINPREFEQRPVSEYAEIGTQSTHESTHESTQAPNRELRTPSIRLTGNKSQIINNNNEPPIGAFIAHWEKQTATYAAPVIRDEIAAWVRNGGTFAYFEECTRAYVTGGGRNWNFMAMILRDGPNKPAPKPTTAPAAQYRGKRVTPAAPGQMTSEERAARRARALAEAEAQMAAGLAAAAGD